MGAIAEGFLAYAQPLLEQTDGSEEELHKAFAMGQFCFTLALLPEESRNEALRDIRPTLNMDDDEFDAFQRVLVDPMIQRHQEMFPRMHGRVSTGPSPSRLLPRVDPIKAATSGKYPGTDRYAPCPCNSGEKYKFCCGARGR